MVKFSEYVTFPFKFPNTTNYVILQTHNTKIGNVSHKKIKRNLHREVYRRSQNRTHYLQFNIILPFKDTLKHYKICKYGI